MLPILPGPIIRGKWDTNICQKGKIIFVYAPSIVNIPSNRHIHQSHKLFLQMWSGNLFSRPNDLINQRTTLPGMGPEFTTLLSLIIHNNTVISIITNNKKLICLENKIFAVSSNIDFHKFSYSIFNTTDFLKIATAINHLSQVFLYDYSDNIFY